MKGHLPGSLSGRRETQSQRVHAATSTAIEKVRGEEAGGAATIGLSLVPKSDRATNWLGADAVNFGSAA